MITGVSRETRARLDALTALVMAETERQNLVSAATLPEFQARHIDDSLQLLPLIANGPLLDIGSGAGFPGLVLACALDTPVHLVEPRARRAAFLTHTVRELGLSHVSVHQKRIERLDVANISTITARAVAALGGLFDMAIHIATDRTRWVLPKGRSAQSELDAACVAWQGDFELVASSTDPDAAIVVAERVRRRSRAA